MGFDRDVLLRAGIEDADAFAAVSSGDNSNIISRGWPARRSASQRVVARIYDAKRAAVYERLGIPTVATVPWTTDRLLDALDPTTPRPPSGVTPVRQRRGHRARAARGSGSATASPTSEAATGAPVAFLIRFGAGDPARAQDRHPGRRPGLRRGRSAERVAEAMAIAGAPRPSQRLIRRRVQ